MSMRKLLLIGCSVVLAAGCSSKSPPVNTAALRAGGSGGAAVGPLSPPPPGQWNQSTAGIYSPVQAKQKAAELGEALNSRSPNAVMHAAVSLGELGETGYPYLVKGLQSPAENVRLVCLQSMTRSELVKNQQQTMPIVFEMLQDPNPEIRRGACMRLAWYGKSSAQFIRVLQAMSESDADGNVRASAAIAVNAIYEAMSGKTITSAPDGPQVPK